MIMEQEREHFVHGNTVKPAARNAPAACANGISGNSGKRDF